MIKYYIPRWVFQLKCKILGHKWSDLHIAGDPGFICTETPSGWWYTRTCLRCGGTTGKEMEY